MKLTNQKTQWMLWIATLIFKLIVCSSQNYSRYQGYKREALSFRPLHFAAVDLPLGDRGSNGNGSPNKAGAFKFDDADVVGAGTYEIKPDGVDIGLNLKISSEGSEAAGGGGGEPEATGSPGAPSSPSEAPGGPGNGPGGSQPEATGSPGAPNPPSEAGGEPGAEPGGSEGAPGTPTSTTAPKPALCPVPCSQTKPTQAPGGGSSGPVTITGPSVPTSAGGEGAGASPATSAPTSPPGGATPSQGLGGSAPQPTTGGGRAAPPSASAGGSPFEQEGLKKHNEYRKVHGVPPMTLNAKMSSEAAAYAQEIARKGALTHASAKQRNNDGENLSMGCDSDGQTAAEATTNWYNEVCDPGHTFGQPSGSPGTGHFTQVVWKKSVELGIGKADVDKDGMKCTYIVGRYRPAGNMGGEYAENVPKGSFNKAQACAGVRRATILNYIRRKTVDKIDKRSQY